MVRHEGANWDGVSMNELNIYAAREIADQLGVSPHTVRHWAAMGAPIDPENLDVSALKEWISSTGTLRPWPAEFMEHVIEETIG
ncbi:MAG TPA: hypothetical protein VGN42_21925, partial [Pirellulales bacterium]|nr:hypothetical protein [Pirellulales bacterium]